MDRINTQLKTIHQQWKTLFLIRALRLVKCRETAEDIVQEAYANVIKIMRVEDRAFSDNEVKKLILSCIKRRFIDLRRKKQNQLEISISYRDSEEQNPILQQINGEIAKNDPSQTAEDYLQLKFERLVKEAKLSALEKEILSQCQEGEKVAQIAKNVGLSPRQVSNCKHKLFLKLRKRITGK